MARACTLDRVRLDAEAGRRSKATRTAGARVEIVHCRYRQAHACTHQAGHIVFLRRYKLRLVGQLREFEFLSKELLVGYELCRAEQSTPPSIGTGPRNREARHAGMRRTFARTDGLEGTDSDDAVAAREPSVAVSAAV